jgi:hypothetical protein
MKLKDGVSLQDVSWRMFHAAVVAEKVYATYGAELVITSANDGKHGDKTLHHKGLALDLRTWNLGGREMQVASDLAKALGNDYDVVLERDHIHLEWDQS